MKLKITVHGVAYEVDVEVLDAGQGLAAPTPLPVPAVPRGAPPAPPRPAATAALPSRGAPSAGGRRSIASPVAGTVLEVRCKAGEGVEENQVVFVLEAMKMKTSIAAPAKGRIAEVAVAAGDTVSEGQPLLHYE